jgi:hypothetical protein
MVEKQESPEKKPETISNKNMYIVGFVIVIVIIAIAGFYMSSIGLFEMPGDQTPPPEGNGRYDASIGGEPQCGNNVCETGETYDTCPQDCERPPPSVPATVSVSPSAKSVSNGETFTLDVEIKDAYDLFGFQFNVEYDENVLEFKSPGLGPFLKKDGRSTFCVDYNNETAGIVRNIACTRLGRGSLDGDGVLEILTFKAIGTGTSPVTLTNVKLANPKAEKLDSIVSNGEVIVS